MKKLTVFMILPFLISVCFAQPVAIARHPAAQKKVALTFDDGPHPKYTPEILEILAQYDAKATFFMIGSNAAQYPDLVKQVYKAGHELGNHTYNHVFTSRVTDDKLKEEIQKTDDIIREITGVSPVVFRPPGGIYNDQKLNVIDQTGHKCILWSWWQDTRDWSCPSVDSVVSCVLDNLRDGDIILFHDYNGGKSPTPEALRRILPELKNRGYEPVSVSQLLACGQDE